MIKEAWFGPFGARGGKGKEERSTPHIRGVVWRVGSPTQKK